MADLIDVLIEAQTDLDWCADPSDLERALIRLVDLEPRDDVAAPLQQKIAQLKLARTNPSACAAPASRPVCRISLRTPRAAVGPPALRRVRPLYSSEAGPSA